MKSRLPVYSMEHCEELLRQDQVGLARLFAISQGRKNRGQRGQYKRRQAEKEKAKGAAA